MSSAALSYEGSPGREVIREVLKSGGRVVLVRGAEDMSAAELSHLERIRQEFGGDRISVVTARSLIQPNLWLCDYLGLFGRGPDGSCQHLQVQYVDADEDGPITGIAPLQFPDKVRAATVWPKVYAKGGDLLVLDAETIAISERTRQQNRSQFSPNKLAHTLNLIGMKRAVFLPSTDNDVEHVDSMVTVINGACFIPELYEGQSEVLQQRFDTARERLEGAGFPVYGLPMMLPEEIGSASHTISPCNLRLVRALDGSLTACVPIREGTPTDLKGRMEEILLEKGRVDRVVLMPSSPLKGGLIHCMTAEVPDSLVSSF